MPDPITVFPVDLKPGDIRFTPYETYRVTRVELEGTDEVDGFYYRVFGVDIDGTTEYLQEALQGDEAVFVTRQSTLSVAASAVYRARGLHLADDDFDYFAADEAMGPMGDPDFAVERALRAHGWTPAEFDAALESRTSAAFAYRSGLTAVA